MVLHVSGPGVNLQPAPSTHLKGLLTGSGATPPKTFTIPIPIPEPVRLLGIAKEYAKEKGLKFHAEQEVRHKVLGKCKIGSEALGRKFRTSIKHRRRKKKALPDTAEVRKNIAVAEALHAHLTTYPPEVTTDYSFQKPNPHTGMIAWGLKKADRIADRLLNCCQRESVGVAVNVQSTGEGAPYSVEFVGLGVQPCGLYRACRNCASYRAKRLEDALVELVRSAEAKAIQAINPGWRFTLFTVSYSPVRPGNDPETIRANYDKGQSALRYLERHLFRDHLETGHYYWGYERGQNEHPHFHIIVLGPPIQNSDPAIHRLVTASAGHRVVEDPNDPFLGYTPLNPMTGVRGDFMYDAREINPSIHSLRGVCRYINKPHSIAEGKQISAQPYEDPSFKATINLQSDARRLVNGMIALENRQVCRGKGLFKGIITRLNQRPDDMVLGGKKKSLVPSVLDELKGKEFVKRAMVIPAKSFEDGLLVHFPLSKLPQIREFYGPNGERTAERRADDTLIDLDSGQLLDALSYTNVLADPPDTAPTVNGLDPFDHLPGQWTPTSTPLDTGTEAAAPNEASVSTGEPPTGGHRHSMPPAGGALADPHVPDVFGDIAHPPDICVEQASFLFGLTVGGKRAMLGDVRFNNGATDGQAEIDRRIRPRLDTRWSSEHRCPAESD